MRVLGSRGGRRRAIGEQRTGGLLRRLRPGARKAGPLAMAGVLAAGVLTIGAAPVSAIPTTHEIKTNWVGNPTSVLLGTVLNAEWHINTNDASNPPRNADVNNVTLTVTATNGKFASLPSSCKKTGVTPVSSLSADGFTMVCNLGTVKEGTATVVQTPLRATDLAGGKVTASGTVTSGSAVAPAGPAALPPVQITYSNGLDVNIQYAPTSRYQGNLTMENGQLRTQMRINYSVILKHGSRPGPLNYNFPLTISSTTPGARLTGLTFEECRPVAWPSQAHPWSGAQADRTNFPGCTVTGTGLSYTVRLSNLDYTLTRVPVNDSLGNPLPTGYGSYIASGSIVFSLPGEVPVTTNYAYNINPPNVTFPAVGGAPAQTLAEGPKTNNATSVTLYVPGEFSNSWQGTPTASRDPWDDQLFLTPGTSQSTPLPAPDGIPSGDPLPLYSQAVNRAWNSYTGAGGARMAGVCTMRQQDPQSGFTFAYNKADFYTWDGAYKDMTTAELWVYTGAITNTKTFTCGPSLTGWTKIPIPAGTHAGDPRSPNTYLVNVPPATRAIKVTWNPAVDKGTQVVVRGFGYITPTAPFSVPPNYVEGWTIGGYNRPGENYWRNYSDSYNGTPTASATATPWSTYAVGTNGWRDVYRIIGYKGTINKVAGDTSAPPGVPVTYTLTAQATTTATSALPTTITVTDTIPTGMTYVAGSATPAPLSISGQTITWRFTNVPVNENRVITYQAVVPLTSTRPPGTQLTNTAVVSVPGDIRPVEDRRDTATVVIPNNGATILGKSATDNVLSFYGDTSSWRLVINSFDPSTNAYTDTIDVLPYKGDPNGTTIDGGYTVTTVQAPAGSKIYYSTADPATISTDPRTPSNGGPNTIVGNTVGWTTVKPAKPTAIRVIGPALAPGTVQTITINYTTPAGTNCVTPAGTDNKPGQKLVNEAGSYAGHTALPMLSSAETVIGDCYALDLVKSVLRKGGDPAVETDWHDADTVADYQQYADGDSPQYRIVVTNKGTGTLTNVAVVDDKFPVDCNETIPELLPGASSTILCTGEVTFGTTVNTATATADPADGPNLTASDPAGVVVPEPFEVRKVSEPPAGSDVNPGDVITYTITVTEPATSPAPFGNPSLTDDLADVLDAADYNGDVLADYGTASVVNGVLNWSAPVLTPGQTVTITYSVTVKPLGTDGMDGDLVNAVTTVGGNCPDPAITDPTDPAFDPDCSTTLRIPSYTVVKSAIPAPPDTVVEPGDTVTYSVVVTNTGPTTASASITDDLTAVLDDAVYNGDATAGPGNPVPLVSGNTLSWSKALAVGEVVTLTYSVTLKPSTALGNGQLDNVVTATGPTTSCLAGQQGAECRTHHDTAAIRYQKVISDPDVLNIEDGQEFTYTITATNVGNVALGSSVGRPIDYADDISEVIDDAIYNDDASADVGSVTFNSPDELYWTADLLAVGQTATITYTVTVENDIAGGDNVLFNAIVGTGPGSNCVVDPVRPECVTQVPKPLLESRKVITAPAPPETVDAGDTVTYQVTVRNIGADVARSIPILDDMSDALDAAVYNNDAIVTSSVIGNTPAAATYQAPELLWTGDIAVDETITITYTMTVNGIEELGDDGSLTNFLITADCPSPPIVDPAAPGFDADCVTITPIPGYTIEKSSVPVEGSVIRPGTPVTYTLTLRNTGGVALTPTIVDDLTDIVDDADYVPGTSTVNGAPVADLVSGSTLTWNGPLPIDGVVTIGYQVVVEPAADLANGDLLNTVSGDGPTNCVAPIVTVPTAPGYDARCVNDIKVEAYEQSKASVPVPTRPSGDVQPGDRVDYTVTIRNTGGVALNPTIFDDMTQVIDDADLVTTGPNAPASDSGPAPVFDPTTNRFTWSGPLAVGQTIHLTYSVIIKDTASLGDGILDNVTTGTGPTTCPTDNPPDECKTRELVESVKFKKVITNPNVLELQPGDEFTYTVTVENTGAVALTAATNNQASFEDDLTQVLDDADLDIASITESTGDAVYVPGTPPLLRWSGDLAVGQTATITYTVTIRDPIPADGVLINGIEGDGPGANCEPPVIMDPGHPDFDPDCSTRVPQPLLDTVKEIVSPATPGAGSTITYRITTTNTGVGPALGVSVIDDLTDVVDDGTYMDDAAIVEGGGILSAYDATTHELAWNGDIPAGGRMVITYTVIVKTLNEMADPDNEGDGVLLNTLAAPGCPTPPVTEPTAPGYDDECLTVTPIPGYIIEKSSDPVEGTEVLPGSQVDYTLTVRNVGGVDLTPTITDDMAGVTDDATYVAGSAAAAYTVGGSGTPDAPDVGVGSLTWNDDKDDVLPVGSTLAITYSVLVDDATDLSDADLGNVVGGDGPTNCPMPPITDPTDPNFDARCVNTIPVKAWTLVKSSDPASGTAVVPGEVITYTLTIVNTGSVPVTPEVVDDLSDVLDDADYTELTEENPDPDAQPAERPDFDADGQEIRWSKEIQPGDVVEVKYQVTIKDVDPSTGRLPGDGILANVVTTTGDESPCPPAGLKPPGAGCATQHPVKAVRYEKSIDQPDVLEIQPGDTFTYTVKAINIGQADLSGPDDLHFVDDMSQVLDDATGPTNIQASTGTVTPPVAPGTTLIWDGGTVAVGAEATITYDVTVKPIDQLNDAILVNLITGTGPGSNCIDPVQGPECITQVPQPKLESTKTVIQPSTPVPGGTITYQITVRNIGEGAAINVPVVDDMRDALDAADYNDDADANIIGSLVWTDPVLTWRGTIGAGEAVTITYTMTVHDVLDLGDGVLTNVLLTPDCPNPPVLDPTALGYDADCLTVTPVPGYVIDKSFEVVSGNDPLVPGDVVNYTVTATNVGAVALNETITDDLSQVLDDATGPTNLTASSGATPTVQGQTIVWTGDIAIGATITIQYTMTVKDLDELGDGKLDNAVTGTGETNCKSGAPTADCITSNPVKAWDLIKTANTDTVVAGGTITYTITARNVGGVDLTGLTYDDNLSAVLDDAVYNGDAVASSGGVNYVAPVLTWSGDLAVGAQAVVTYTVKVNQPFTGDKQLTNPVTTDEEGPCPPNSGDPECIVDLPGRQLNIVKDTVPADLQSVTPGETVHYRFTVTNTGNVAYLPATAVDHLADALDAANGPSNITVSGPGSASFNAATTEITWSGPLQPGETATIDYDLVVKSPMSADGWLENVVSSPDPGTNCPTDLLDANGGLTLAFGDMPPDCKTTTPIRSQRVVKTSDPGNGATLAVGQLITYTVTIANTGQAALTPATFTDDLSAVLDDATLEGSPIASNGNVSYSAPVLSWSGDLAVGAQASVTYTLRIKAGGDGQLRNTVVSNGPDSNCPDGSANGDCVTSANVLATPPPTPPASTPNTQPDPGELPATGGSSNDLLQIVLLLGLSGLALVLISRRRRRATS
jgi:uncharacterized repeat protein (TIGR01451 family)/fimbrial isopeptide formation D2 family protein/LPXTG-motif cell wall-anchored protein